MLPFGVKYFATFDFESLLQSLSEDSSAGESPEVEQTVDQSTKKLQLRQQHVPLSVSLYSNVPGFEHAEFLWSRDPLDLNKRFYDTLVAMAAKAKELEEVRFEIDREMCQGKQGQQFDKLFMFPVVGFNSGGYDLLLSKNYGLYHLFSEDGIENPIKKGKQYLMLRLTKSGISFFDMMQYSAPGTNLDKYMKSWGQKCGKMVFPYNFLRSYENLEQKEFPAYEEFSSELSGQRIDPQAYDKAKTAYETDPTMHCFLDYLRAYNNNDVEPFFKAVLEQQRWFSQQGLDIFRDGLTLSSHANKIMCRFPLREADQLTEAHLEELAVPSPLTVTAAQIQKRITAYKEQDSRRRQKRARAVGGSSSGSSSSSSSAGAANGGGAANKRVSPAARWSAPKRRKVDRFLDVEAAPPADDSGDECVDDDDDTTQDPSLGGFLVDDDEGEGDDDDRTFSCMVSCRSFYVGVRGHVYEWYASCLVFLLCCFHRDGSGCRRTQRLPPCVCSCG